MATIALSRRMPIPIHPARGRHSGNFLCSGVALPMLTPSFPFMEADSWG
jgi:hypothetical protein